MNEREFLDRVLPRSGAKYFGASVSSSSKFKQEGFSSREDLVNYCTSQAGHERDVYFATGSFATRRTTEASEYKRCLYLDLDCGEGKPYADKKSAALALRDFCAAAELPGPNLLVDSGGGIHAYWTFSQDIPTSDWIPMAERLKDLCEQHSLEADPAVTADAARILRVPGTKNFKDSGNPRPVRVVAANDDYSVADISKALSVAQPSRQRSSPALEVLKGYADDLDLQHDSGRQFYAKEFAPLCNVFRDALLTGGEQHNELLWQHILNVLAFAEDGSKFIHAVSDKHPGYKRGATIRKFESKLAVRDRSGPTLCRTFGSIMPDACKACKFKGQIKSPLHLTETRKADDLPYGYARDDKAMYKIVEDEDEEGNKVKERVRIFHYAITDFELFQSNEPADGFIYKFTAARPGVKKSVSFNTKQLMDKRAIFPQMNSCGVGMQVHEYQEVLRLMTSWSQKMIEAKQVTTATPCLGWVEESKSPGFTLIKDTLYKDGRKRPATFVDPEFVKDYEPRGDSKVWRDLSHYLTSQGRHAISAGIVSAFAAPLIKFTGVNGCVLALISEKSGTGKTTALKTAQAVWGDPARGVNALDDTPLSVANRMGKLKNLPAFWDELRIQEQVQRFIVLMFQVSQGKERSRLTSGIQTRHVGTWNTLITVASNESLIDHVKAMVHGTDAGLLRVFEVDTPDIPEGSTDCAKDVGALGDNFGWAGLEYRDYLIQNYDEVVELVRTCQEEVRELVQAEISERFWTATAAALLAGARIANKLDLTRIDIDGFLDWLGGEFKRNRRIQKEEYASTEKRAVDLAFRFCSEHRESVAFVDCMPTEKNGGSVGAVYTYGPTKGPVVAVVYKAERILRVDKQSLGNWLYSVAKETPTKLFNSLLKQGAKEEYTALTRGLPNTLAAEKKVIDIPLKASVLNEIEEVFEVAED